MWNAGLQACSGLWQTERSEMDALCTTYDYIGAEVMQTGFLDSISLRGGPSPTVSTNFASKLCHMQVIYNNAHDRKTF
jgi:hypothetical protein